MNVVRLKINPSKLRYGLCIAMAMTMLGMWSIYHAYGTSIAEYYAHQQELERGHDVEVLDYTDSVLFGDPIHKVDESIDLQASGSASEGFEMSERIRGFDRMVLVALTMATFRMSQSSFQYWSHGYSARWLYSLYPKCQNLMVGISMGRDCISFPAIGPRIGVLDGERYSHHPMLPSFDTGRFMGKKKR